MRVRALPAGLLAALALAGTAGAVPGWGVVEDQTKYAVDGGRGYFLMMKDIGFEQSRITVLWNPSDPTTIQDKAFLDRLMPVARELEIGVVFAVYPSVAAGISADPRTRIALFSQYVATLLRTYPGQVKEVYVGNEVNQPRFFQPQFVNRLPVAPALYEQTLAAVYDTVKSVDPSVIVTASLSPHGNDNPAASGNVSLSPARFLKLLGDAYRASKRTTRIMDRIAVNVYPYNNESPPTKRTEWPNVGVSTFDRVKQAFWDAFHGTGQPTFAEGPARLALDGDYTEGAVGELGWQAETETHRPSCPPSCHTKSENVKPISEALQAQYYAQAVQLLACDPALAEVNVLHLIDEQDLTGFQSGLLRLDGSKRPSYDAVKSALAGLSCPTLHSWSHTTRVVGAGADFGAPARAYRPARVRLYSFHATAEENALALGGIYRVRGPNVKVSPGQLAGLRPVLTHSRLVEAGRNPLFQLRGNLPPGYYVYGLTLAAEMNTRRTSTFVGDVFEVRR